MEQIKPEHRMNRFERQQALSIYWFHRANDLRGGAGAVWFAMTTDSEHIRSMLELESQYRFSVATPFVFFLLCGLSLELLFKALVIETKNKPPRTHNLRKLVEMGKLELSDADLELMDVLTINIVWAGKYPVPMEGEPEYNKAVALMDKALMGRVAGSSIPLMQRNQRLDWADYSRIWNVAWAEYWRRYQLRRG